MTTPPKARTRPGISILYLRRACPATTRPPEPTIRNAPHVAVSASPIASYDFGGDTSTHVPAVTPASHPRIIAALWTLSAGTGYGLLNMGYNFPVIQCLLERLRGALKPNTVSLHADLLLQGDNHLRPLRATPREPPCTRHNTVTQFNSTVGTGRHGTIHHSPQKTLQRPPHLLPRATILGDTETLLQHLDRRSTQTAILRQACHSPQQASTARAGFDEPPGGTDRHYAPDDPTAASFIGARRALRRRIPTACARQIGLGSCVRTRRTASRIPATRSSPSPFAHQHQSPPERFDARPTIDPDCCVMYHGVPTLATTGQTRRCSTISFHRPRRVGTSPQPRLSHATDTIHSILLGRPGYAHERIVIVRPVNLLSRTILVRGSVPGNIGVGSRHYSLLRYEKAPALQVRGPSVVCAKLRPWTC